MSDALSVSVLPKKQKKIESQTVLDYRKCSKFSKGKSLLIYIFQSVICFLLLGPLISIFLSQLWEYLGKPVQQKFWSSGDILFAAPIGFALSLLVDRDKAPPKIMLTPFSNSYAMWRFFYSQPYIFWPAGL